MSRTSFPFLAGDIAAVARSLRSQLEGRGHPPGHVELLNMLARATGHRNYQHFRAQACAAMRVTSAPAVPEPVDYRRVERIARHFDLEGRLIRWPRKASHRHDCLWALWAVFPATGTLSEREVNAVLNQRHLFGDPAILRRSLCDANLLSRTPDCRVYRRIERRPPPDAVALIRRLQAVPA